jgi:chromosome segregation ATPase
MAEAHRASPNGEEQSQGISTHDFSENKGLDRSTSLDQNNLFDIPEDSDLPPLPINDDEDLSLAQLPSSSRLDSDVSAFMDKDMRRNLMDVESSFLPELEPEDMAEGAKKGVDDTYLFGGSPGNGRPKGAPGHKRNKKSIAEQIRESLAAQAQIAEEEREGSKSPATPPSAYKTPYHGNENFGIDGNVDSTKSSTELETLPSSPAAAAAERTQSRPVHTIQHVEAERTPEQSFEDASAETAIKNGHQRQNSHASTIRLESNSSELEDDTSMPEPTLSPEASSDNVLASLHSPRGSMSSSRLLKRPSFLQQRTSSQRSSVSSFTNRSITSEGSDATLGADFSLQSGGAVPGSGSMRPGISLSRLPSMSSIASSNGSSYGEAPSWDRSRSSAVRERELERLEEERGNAGSPPETPRAGENGGAPTDTVIAQHVQNIQVPETVAREYREKHPHSPARSQALGLSMNRQKSNLTLKEQNSKIDKLSKENFDLKLKIHFLDQALQNRSEEGVKDMINKNVQLQTDLANEKKDSQALRKKMRELERKMKAQEEGQAAKQVDVDDNKSDQSEKQAEMEEEIIYLRETLQETEMEVERLREENLGKEVDKRKLADYIKSTNERKASENDKGVEETIEMWKDLLESETARREQADEDAEKLREELRRLKTETSSLTTNNNVRNIYNVNKRHNVSYNTRSDAGSAVGEDFNSTVDSNASTVVEQLKHENAELRRDLSAQTSMLTSRNRERERLQQEIEDLKINQRRHGDGVGARSIAGDSIFDRSVSRAHNRAESRASGHTRVTQLSDVEEYDKKFARLRDELAQVKMTNQDLERELNAHLDILQNVEEENRALKEEKDSTLEDLQSIQTEREEALLALQEQEEENEALRNEANDEIEKLDLALEQKETDFEALQQEMKSVSESVVRLEDDLTASRRKEQDLEQQIEDIMQELEQTDQKLRDTSAKNERLDVQLESSQTEVQFLREEQEGDKIKIGDLEAALNAAQTSLQDERERIGEERRQREVLDSQEKADWQKMIDELNDDVNKFKGESNRLRKNLSVKDTEASQWKERLETMEGNLREALGSPNSTSSSILKVCSFLRRTLLVTNILLGGHETAARSRTYTYSARCVSSRPQREGTPSSRS